MPRISGDRYGQAPAPEVSQTAEVRAEYGGYYYYDAGDRALLFLETALYIGLCISALIILDENVDDLTIIIQE